MRLIIIFLIISLGACSTRNGQKDISPCSTDKAIVFNPIQYKDQECVVTDYYICDTTTLNALSTNLIETVEREDSNYIWKNYFFYEGTKEKLVKTSKIYKNYWCNNKFKRGKE